MFLFVACALGTIHSRRSRPETTLADVLPSIRTIRDVATRTVLCWPRLALFQITLRLDRQPDRIPSLFETTLAQ